MSSGFPTLDRPTLDREAEPWTGTFPGLGTVRVAADGTVEVEAEPGDEHEARAAALRHGWGEPLSFARRGFDVVPGAAVVPPHADDTGPCVVLTGAVHDTALVLAVLVARGWSVLADRLVPCRWVGEVLVAHPGASPVVMGRRAAERAGLDAEPVRADTDAVVVAVPRSEAPRRVGTVVEVGVRRVGEPALEPCTGLQRFESAACLFAGGVFTRVDDAPDAPRRALARSVALASLPFLRLRFTADTLDADVDALVAHLAADGAAPHEVSR